MASTDAKPADAAKAQSETQAQPPAEQQKPTSTALGEDDEFEDFPVDGAFLLCPLRTSIPLCPTPLLNPPVAAWLALQHTHTPPGQSSIVFFMASLPAERDKRSCCPGASAAVDSSTRAGTEPPCATSSVKLKR